MRLSSPRLIWKTNAEKVSLINPRQCRIRVAFSWDKICSDKIVFNTKHGQQQSCLSSIRFWFLVTVLGYMSLKPFRQYYRFTCRMLTELHNSSEFQPDYGALFQHTEVTHIFKLLIFMVKFSPRVMQFCQNFFLNKYDVTFL